MLKKNILPLMLIVLCLALLAGGAGLFYLLTQYGGSSPTEPAASIQVETLYAVTLADSWADEAFASDDPAAQQAAITDLLLSVQALGANAIALTGRLSDGSTLFYDESETLARPESLYANDTWRSSYDGFDALIAAANAYGIEVLLTPTQESGATLADATTLPDFITTLCKKHSLRLLLDDGLTYLVFDLAANTYATLTEVDSDEPVALALRLQLDDSASEPDLLLGDYDALCADATDLFLFTAYYAAGETLPDLRDYLGDDYARTLAVTYPTENGSTVSTSSLFLMGTSDPDAALTLDGETIERYGTEGVWGVLVSLRSGENTFTLENGTDTLSYTVTYQSQSSGGSSSSGSGAVYQTLPEGQTILITDEIASALSNVYSASTITQTFYSGAVAEVTRCLTATDGVTPYAYQLTTGDWVRADYCELYDTGRMALSQPAVSYNSETRATELTFTGGTPAVYHLWEDNTLTLTLMTADYSASAPTADWFDCTLSTSDGGDAVLTFTFAESEPLYGWAVVYDTDTNRTTISLKQTPTLSEDESLPLSGVRVLLDAGHGDTDLGAMGSGGLAAPCEKDVNLALTMATAYRLEQLGATVILSRDDDSYPTLGDRVTQLNEEQPDFFISIHHNSIELSNDVNNTTGVEAYWFYDEGEALATALIEAISETTGRSLRSTNYGYYYVTRSNICPATLLEVGFMTNPAEYEDIANEETIWAEAGAIAQAIYDLVAANH